MPKIISLKGTRQFNRLIEIFYEDGTTKELSINKSLKVVNHSPTGFEWGYGGSGPSQLALAILLEATTTKEARSYYQDFKWDFVSKFAYEEWELSREEIDTWLQNKRAQAW